MGFQANNVQTPSGEIPGGSTFKGDMIEIVYKTVYKLQDHYVKTK